MLAFHAINFALIRIAQDRNDYVHLRLKADRKEWLQRIKQAPLDESIKHIFRNKNIWIAWTSDVRNDRRMAIVNLSPQERVEKNLPKLPFEDFNYLYVDKYFRRIKSVVDRGAVDLLLVDITDRKSLTSVTNWLQCTHNTIGVFDTSNVIEHVAKLGDSSEKTKDTHAITMIDVLSPYIQPSSIFLYTFSITHTQPVIPGTPGELYFGFKFYRFSELQNQAPDYTELKQTLRKAHHNDTAIRRQIANQTIGSPH